MDSSANVIDVTPEVVVAATVPVVVVAATVPVVVPVVSALDKNVEALFKAITTDSSFLARVKISVDKIMHDGKVDQYDIPEIVFVISDTVNSLPSFQVTSEVVPVLIKMLYNFIVDTYSLVPADKKADFERMVDSSLRLLMLQPKIKEGLNRCFAFMSCK
jgi:hypothetical protein